MMEKIDWLSYLKLLFGTLLIFPLEWMFWALDFGVINGLLITISVHTPLFILGVIMFNYLETGDCFQLSKKL